MPQKSFINGVTAGQTSVADYPSAFRQADIKYLFVRDRKQVIEQTVAEPFFRSRSVHYFKCSWLDKRGNHAMASARYPNPNRGWPNEP